MLRPASDKLARGVKTRSTPCPRHRTLQLPWLVSISENSFHTVGHDDRGAIVLRQKWSRVQVETRLSNIDPVHPPVPNFPFSPRHSGRSLVR